MQVAKWGNSLAVRLPAAVVEALKLKEGDDIEIQVSNRCAGGGRVADVALQQPGSGGDWPAALAAIEQVQLVAAPEGQLRTGRADNASAADK